MPDNVVPFTGETRLDMDPQRVISAAYEAGLTSVVIVGFDADGNEYFGSSDADGGAILWHLERAKHKLMSLPDDD